MIFQAGAGTLQSYLLTVNLLAFVLFGVDKARAVRHGWRIRESVLLGTAFLGGSLGALAAMRLFHHKTRKKKFSVGIPFMLVLHIALALYLTAGWR